MSTEPQLTPRQMEIARLLARELSYKAVAATLDISIRTVHKHVYDAARQINPDTPCPKMTLALWFDRSSRSEAA